MRYTTRYYYYIVINLGILHAHMYVRTYVQFPKNLYSRRPLLTQNEIPIFAVPCKSLTKSYFYVQSINAMYTTTHENVYTHPSIPVAKTTLFRHHW